MFNYPEIQISLNQAFTVKQKIDQANKILLITHQYPDADAIGSITAIINFLEQIDKNYIAFCSSKIPDNLEYLYKSYNIFIDAQRIIRERPDLVIVLDCGSIKRTGVEDLLLSYIDSGIEVINIDHHLNSLWGTINITNETASATSVILYDLLKYWGGVINKDIATSLLSGILTDTDNFSNSGTNSKAIEVAGKLVELGGKYVRIIKNLHKDKGGEWFNFFAKVLSRLVKNDKINIAYSVILYEDLQKLQLGVDEGVANFFNHLDGLKFVMVLKETGEEEVKVSLRALHKNIDVSFIASFFGGGGHRAAAGFTIKGRIEREAGYWKIV